MEQVEFNFAHAKSNKNRRVALAVVEQADGKPNVITLEWFMKTSIKPPMFAISVGNQRYSYEALQNNRYFNLVIPSSEMHEETMFFGLQSGRDVNKIELSKLKHFPGKYRKLPIFEKAVANFECNIVTQVLSGDHTIFVGEVKYSWASKEGDKEILSL